MPVVIGDTEQFEVVHLRRGGTSVVAWLGRCSLPCVLHWGPDLGDVDRSDLADVAVSVQMPSVDSVISAQDKVALLPQHSSGWLGRPGLLGSRERRAWSVSMTSVEHTVVEADQDGPSGAESADPDHPAGSVTLRSVGLDEPGRLEVTTDLQLTASGLVRLRAAVRNLAAEPYEVQHLEPAMPVPDLAGELLDMAGRHTHERRPQRRDFEVGSWVREAWGGRPGHDSATLLCAGRPGFGFRRGRVWGVHLAWSGNQVISAERTVTGWRLLRGGELLLPGEIRLGQDEEYTSPWLVASWGEGLDQLSARVHRFLRARPDHPRSRRPVLLNTWEAVYFDHDLSRLLVLAEKAAAVGIERFVLDDGWFRGRRDDRAGLGDWYVDETVWPQGLHPLVDRVRELGMDFGLWFEPEMINLDSDLARRHPDWLFSTEHGPGVPSRYQHVLDLGHPEAYAHVLERMSSLIGEYGIAYVKWDHNRPLVDAAHQPGGAPGVHQQTRAVYRLMAELRRRHPQLEIESCAGGGARLDLGVIDHAQRVWVSDCIDAHERHRMVRYTGLLLPPELMGTHVGSGSDHTTYRTHGLTFRAGTAIWGHLGVEWDLIVATPEELRDLARWIAFHKEVRGLLHTGEVVRADLPNTVLQLDGVVAQDRGEALYRLSALEHTLTWPPGRVPLPGLDLDRRYHVEAVSPGDDDVLSGEHVPAWTRAPVTLPGRLLAEVGLQSPLLSVDHLILIRARAID